MNPLPPVSIIIPTLNEEKYLPRLLESLARIDAPMEIIVVDGNSTDRTVEAAMHFVPNFSNGSSLIVHTRPVRGVAAQRNFGAARASHETILFLDADAYFESAAQYTRLIGLFIRRGYVLAAPYLKPDRHDLRATLIYANAGAFALCMSVFGRAYYAGTCILVRKETYEAVHGFDESRAGVGEDADFTERAGKTGRFGLLPVRLPVSSRRFKKYGYWHVFSRWVLGSALTVLHRADAVKKIDYPFGEFNQ